MTYREQIGIDSGFRGSQNRERYEDWLDRVWGIPAWGTSQQRQPVMRRAAIKRERKAAKRRRDADLSRLGAEASSAWVELVSLWTRDHELGRVALMKRMSAQALMRAIRRGEVVP